MADKKISQLPQGNLTSDTIFPIVSDGITSRINFSDITSQITSSDTYVTGGTYSNNEIIFTNNTGGTFNVTGFTSGMTDSYTTGATLNGNVIDFGNNILGPNLYNVDLTPILSGKTDISLFDVHTGNTSNPHETSFDNLTSTAHTHSIVDITDLQGSLDFKFDKSGGTISNGITANTISATNYLGLPLDIRVTGGTYTSGTAMFTNNTGGTFSVTGFTIPYLGSIVPTSQSTGTTGEGFWTATQAGTYTNFGNVVVSANSFATISRTSGNTFSVSQTPLDLSPYIATTDFNYLIGINKFNKVDNTLGGHTYLNQGINNSGVIGTQSGWVGAKIPVSASTQYSFSHNDGIYTPSGVGLLAYLNSTGGTISTVDMSTLTNAGGLGGKTLTTPSGTAFIYKNVKVTAGGTKDYINTFQLELGSSTTTYNSYDHQIDRIKSLKLVDSDARILISTNTTNISNLTTGLTQTNNSLKYTENWGFSGKANITNPTLIQLAFTIDTSGITFTTGNSYNLNFTITSDDTNINSVVRMRTFQNDNSNALQVGGTSTNQQTIGSFAVPSSLINFDRAIQGTQRYLHVYLELTLTVPSQITTFRYDGIKFTLNGVTKTPLNWAVYQPNSGEQITYATNLPTDFVKFQDLATSTGNFLYGKTMATIGDSMVKGHSLDANQVWDSLISSRNGMINFNYGINGGQLTNDNGFGLSVLNRYSAMTLTADYIGVFAGTNDAVASVPIGTNTDSYSGGQLTFKGALNDLCTGLINQYPNKKVYFITPYNRNSGTQQYITAIITICKNYSIPVFDNWTNGGISWSNTTQTDSITLGDTYHLNVDGMMYASTKYEAFLKSL